jgi:hypothetical protein
MAQARDVWGICLAGALMGLLGLAGFMPIDEIEPGLALFAVSAP